MLPFKTLLQINKSTPTPVYVQIAAAIRQGVLQGQIPAGYKMPGTRLLAEEIGVHRKTVIAAYYELEAQGWLEIHPIKGSFISQEIPEQEPVPLSAPVPQYPAGHNFPLRHNENLDFALYQKSTALEFNGGSPDERLAPLEDIARAYRRALLNPENRFYLSYKGMGGNDYLKAQLCRHLHETRGLKIEPDNLHVTRGSSMALYLSSYVTLQPCDKVLVGQTNYHNANLIFQERGAELVRVPVDEQGLVINEVERVLKKQKIRAIYLTPHHHYPTTVTLSIERRLKLLQLAAQYELVVFEDDYDYDFHYKSSPILPLAAHDRTGNILYLGSFSKTISTGFRLGYIVAPKAVIKEINQVRWIIDTQGDNVFELAFAQLLEDGTIQRHIKKAQKVYHRRRDYFCKTLQEELGHALSFTVPDGGMAIWAEFNPDINLITFSERVRQKGVYLSTGQIHNPPGQNLNATRMGFASMNFTEAEKAIWLLKQSL
ncbi:MAG: PLP-dependent aminotransferase family protein [Rufibacter sp.]